MEDETTDKPGQIEPDSENPADTSTPSSAPDSPNTETQASPPQKAPSDSPSSSAVTNSGADTPLPPPPVTPAAGPSSGADEEKAAKIAAAKARVEASKAAAQAGGQAVSNGGPATVAAATGAPKPPVKKKEEGPVPQDASHHPIVDELKRQFNGAVGEALEFRGQLSVRIERSRIVDICGFLKSHDGAPFNYLSDLTCVHLPERTESPFEVVYNLYSIPANERIRLKVATDEDSPVDSVTGVWPSANWMEREVYDLFGVAFSGHPDLRRLLLPPDWEGHPLRKDYPLQFVENSWTAKHLPEFSEVQREQTEQRRAYGLDILSMPEERQVREIFRAGREVMPLDRK